jgi:hypothetical protein
MPSRRQSLIADKPIAAIPEGSPCPRPCHLPATASDCNQSLEMHRIAFSENAWAEHAKSVSSSSILRITVCLACKRPQLIGLLLEFIDAHVQHVANADHADDAVPVLYRNVANISCQHG